MRLYGIRPWEMDMFTPAELEMIGDDLKAMGREQQ